MNKKRQFDERSSYDDSTDPAAQCKKDVYYLNLDVIDHQIKVRFGKHCGMLAAFD